VRDFLDNKYGLGGKYIHISLMNLEPNTTKKLIEVLENQVDNYKNMSVWDYLERKHKNLHQLLREKGQILRYIDGGHRGKALKHPLVREVENCKFPIAKFYFHHEFKPLKKHNIQTLGSPENDWGSKTIKMTMHDKIVNAVSYLGNLYDDDADPDFEYQDQKDAWKALNDADKLTEKTKPLGILFKKGFINSSETRADMTKYCTIALGVCDIAKQNETHLAELLRIMGNCNDLVWLGATSLWEPKSFRAQKWLFNRVYAMKEAHSKPPLRTSARKKKTKGRRSATTNAPREVIPKYLYKLWEIIVKVANEVDITEAEILSTEMEPVETGSTELMAAYLEEWCKNQRVHDWTVRTNNEWKNVLDEFEKAIRRDCKLFKDRSPSAEVEYQASQKMLVLKQQAQAMRAAQEKENQGGGTREGEQSTVGKGKERERNRTEEAEAGGESGKVFKIEKTPTLQKT